MKNDEMTIEVEEGCIPDGFRISRVTRLVMPGEFYLEQGVAKRAKRDVVSDYPNDPYLVLTPTT